MDLERTYKAIESNPLLNVGIQIKVWYLAFYADI